MATIRIDVDLPPYSTEDARRYVEDRIQQIAPEYAERVQSVTVEESGTVTDHEGESPDDFIRVVAQRLERHLSGESRLF